MIYTTTITSASLRVKESRIISDLLIQKVNQAEWKKKIVEQDCLQLGGDESIRKIPRLLKARLEPMGGTLWEMVRDGTMEQATQSCFAAAIKDSRLLGDFLDITLREQLALFAKKLAKRNWMDYLEGCRGRDPEMPQWSDSTISRLRSAVYSMLAESGYLEDTKSLKLQSVYLDPGLSAYLKDRSERYILRCMEVTQ